MPEKLPWCSLVYIAYNQQKKKVMKIP